MYYIISKFPISFWEGVHVPYIDGTQNRDSEKFLKSKIGQKINNNPPLAIKYVNSKKALAYDVAIDVAFMGLCYNCPLYVYIMKDSYYYNHLDIGFVSLRNFGNVSKLTSLPDRTSEEANQLRIDQTTTYYGGDVDTIELVCNEKFKEINLKNSPIWGYTITAEKGLNKVEDC